MTNGNRRLWWLPDAKEVGAFLAGLGILFHQTVIADAAQTILVVSAVAIMGVLGSGVAQRALRKIIEESSSAPPPPPPPVEPTPPPVPTESGQEA